jgi:hypothetical protein
MRIILITSFIIAVLTSVIIWSNNYQIYNDIVRWQELAAVSPDPQDMLKYMENVRVGMEKWGMNQDDMGLTYDVVNDHVVSLGILQGMDPTSLEYQYMIDRLQRSITALDISAQKYWNSNSGFIWWIFCVPAWTTFLSMGFISIIKIIFGVQSESKKSNS